ncbi:MAG: hypothetical protein ACE369_15985 [Roseovarius sp.]
MARKIATCCYCGTRAVLVLDKARHELSCGACGAPLHEMKMMPQTGEDRPRPARKTQFPAGAPERRRGRPVAPKPDWHGASDEGRRKPRRKKKRKRLLGRVLEEAWDALEDILD